MVCGGGPVEVVAEDGVRRFQLGREVELRAGAGPSGQQLPLHLGGQGEPVLAARLEVEVGVALGHEHLVPEHVGDLDQFGLVPAGLVGRGQRDRQHAEAVAAHTDRQVQTDRPVPEVLAVRPLGTEGPAGRTVVHGDRVQRVRQHRDRLEHRQAVVGHEQLDGPGAVPFDEDGTHGVEKLVGSRCPQGAFSGLESVHDEQYTIFRRGTWDLARETRHVHEPCRSRRPTGGRARA